MKYALWLSNICGISNTKIHMIRDKGYTAEEIYHLDRSELEKIYGISSEDAVRICKSKDTWNLDEQWWRIQEKGIAFMCMEQEDYPQKLRNIVHPPYSFYYKGTLPKPEKKAVAIVGARERSAYGSQVAEQIAAMLAENDIEVVSGLARGIDADAHRGCLSRNGSTYAILGSGVDVCYPRQNQYLYDQILDNGGIISEYPMGTPPHRQNFPQRNRIISAFCDCVVVIEARKKSGSLITADYAMEQGKDVYALPGRITDSLSEGCNHLIQQGAGMIISVEDFGNELHLFDTSVSGQLDFRKNLLEKDERLVYSLLDFCPVGIGTLTEKAKLPFMDIINILERLEHKGFVREEIPNYYVRKI